MVCKRRLAFNLLNVKLTVLCYSFSSYIAFWSFQVLFKNLSVDMKEVKPTCLLKDRVREVEGNPDFSNKDVGATQSQIVPEVNSGVISTLNQVELQPEIVNPSHPSGHLNVLSQVGIS